MKPQPFVQQPPVPLPTLTQREPKPPPVCPKCGNKRTRIVGQSGEPPLVHYRCEDCGHVFSRARYDE
jgi:transposase-like protein